MQAESTPAYSSPSPAYTCPFEPLPGKVVLMDIPRQMTTSGGIVLPEHLKRASSKVVVVAVAPDVDYLEPGDIVAVWPYSGQWEKWDGVKLRVMAADEVLGKWVEDETEPAHEQPALLEVA